MQGKKQFQPELFSTINIENLIPKNHLLRRLDSILDLKFIHELTKELYCDLNGRPSIDPEVFFRMNLVSYLYGISSDRQLCEELQFNLAYRWFCRFSLADTIPDHSSMTRIRDRFGKDVFERIFNQVLELCRERGLLKVKGEVLIDASLVQANAALNSLVPKNSSEEEIQNRPQLVRGGQNNKTHISCTDPDSTLATKIGAARKLYYKIHNTVESESRVILDPHVTTGSTHDGKMLMDRIEYVQAKRDFEVESVVADRAYGFGENLVALKEQKIDAHIGTFHRNAGGAVKDLKYNAVEDSFRCPSGQWLYAHSKMDDGNVRYGFRDRPCTNCKQRGNCPVLPKLKREKYVVVSQHHQIMRKASEHEKTPLFAEKLKARMWKIEGLFAEAKVNHCLNRAKNRGLAKVQIQAYMIGMVQNLKRLLVHTDARIGDLILNFFVELGFAV